MGKNERKRELLREWKKNNPDKVRQQKKQYYARNKDKRRNELNRWREKNPEKVKAQKCRYRERKAWPRILGTRPRGKKDRCDPDKIVLLDARVELTDYRRTATQSTNNPQDMDDFDPDEILRGMFQSKSPKRKPTKRKTHQKNNTNPQTLRRTKSC